MYLVRRTKQFEKSFKKIKRSGIRIDLKREVATVIDVLTSQEKYLKNTKIMLCVEIRRGIESVTLDQIFC